MPRLPLLILLLVTACDGPETTDAAVPVDTAVRPPPTVMTTHGPVIGSHLFGATAFLGIPYAAPPVGPLRWAPPEAPSATTGADWPAFTTTSDTQLVIDRTVTTAMATDQANCALWDAAR